MDPLLHTKKITATFLHEEGEDVDGITREVFSLFWRECLPRYFEGVSTYYPHVDSDCTYELLKLFGSIASHGYVLTGKFPIQIAQSSIMGVLIGNRHVSDEMLLRDFMSYVSEEESTAIRGVLEGKRNVGDDVLDCLSNFNVRSRVTKETIRGTLLDIARCEFLLQVQSVMMALKDRLIVSNPELWSDVKPSVLNNLFSSLQITRQRLAKAIVPSPD